MSKINTKLKGFMVTVSANGDVSCVETNHRYLDIYVMAFSDETPTTLRFLVNGTDNEDVCNKAKIMAKDLYSRREKDFPYLGKSYKSLDVFKKTPIQLCAESFKTVYYYEWDDMIHPKDTDKLPNGFAFADKDVYIEESKKRKKVSRIDLLKKTTKTLMTKNYKKRINSHVKSLWSSNSISDDVLNWSWQNMKNLINKSTITELSAFWILKKMKVDFLYQAPFVFAGNVFFADFYLSDYNIVIEIDGEYHESETQCVKDNERDNMFTWDGIRTIRVKNDVALDEEKFIKVLSDASII